MNRPITITLAFWLYLNISGAYGNREVFDLWIWGTGFLCMLPLATVWFFNKAIAGLLSITGIGFLLLTAMGVFEGYALNKVFFNGCSVGFVSGFIIAYMVHLPRSYKAGLFLSEMDNYPAISKYFQKKISEANNVS